MKELNNKKFKIAIVSNETTPAVCSSMMMHVNMMADCGHEITLVVSSKVNTRYFGENNYRLLTYSSKQDLKAIIITHSFDKIWTTNSMYALYLTYIGIKVPLYLWMQGDIPAESYMRHHSKFRRYIAQLAVASSFRHIKGIVYVSEAMKEYYESHYHIIPKNSIVVPCLSEFEGLKFNTERIPNSFVYIGGLSVWQCFDEILTLYKELRTNNSIFHIITLDIDEAKKRVSTIIGDTHNIEIYSISDRTQIPNVLSKFQYGFLIRRDDVVNLVAAPIKFLEYISCGVNVIMTNAVPSYAKIVEQYKIGTIVKIGSPTQLNPYNANAQKVHDKLFNRKLYIEHYNMLLNQ